MSCGRECEGGLTSQKVRNFALPEKEERQEVGWMMAGQDLVVRFGMVFVFDRWVRGWWDRAALVNVKNFVPLPSCQKVGGGEEEGLDKAKNFVPLHSS
jgi:hypothetical protein